MKFQSQASVSLRKASVSHGDPLLGLSVIFRKGFVSHRGLWVFGKAKEYDGKSIGKP